MKVKNKKERKTIPEVQNCPECGAPVSENESICQECGYQIKHTSSKKKYKKLIILGATVLILIIAISVCIVIIPITHSQQAFIKGQACENDKQYEEALINYSLVIARDSENYGIACEKITEMNEAVKKNKLVSLAYIALNNQNLASSFDSLTNIEADDKMVTCKINEIGYMITKESKESSEDYTNHYTDIATGLSIIEYKADFMYNGWLTESTNDILQSTSDTMFEVYDLWTTTDYISGDMINGYLEQYKTNGDLSFLGDAT